MSHIVFPPVTSSRSRSKYVRRRYFRRKLPWGADAQRSEVLTSADLARHIETASLGLDTDPDKTLGLLREDASILSSKDNRQTFDAVRDDIETYNSNPANAGRPKIHISQDAQPQPEAVLQFDEHQQITGIDFLPRTVISVESQHESGSVDSNGTQIVSHKIRQ